MTKIEIPQQIAWRYWNNVPGTIMICHPESKSVSARIVGTCYLHGIMKGETMEWIEKGKVKVRNIAIS